MIQISSLSHLTNPIVSAEQLLRLQETSNDDTQSLRFAESQLTQAAGVLLRLPQDVIATAIVALQRYWVNEHALTIKHTIHGQLQPLRCT